LPWFHLYTIKNINYNNLNHNDCAIRISDDVNDGDNMGKAEPKA